MDAGHVISNSAAETVSSESCECSSRLKLNAWTSFQLPLCNVLDINTYIEEIFAVWLMNVSVCVCALLQGSSDQSAYFS